MANDEFWARAAEVNEQFRPVEVTAGTVSRRAGTQTRTVHSFLRHLRDQGLDCVPEPLSLVGETETLRRGRSSMPTACDPTSTWPKQ